MKAFHFYRSVWLRKFIYARSILNRLRFASAAPLVGDIIYINPRDVKFVVKRHKAILSKKYFGKEASISAKITDTSLLKFEYLENKIQFKSISEHFIYGAEWDKTRDFQGYCEIVRNSKKLSLKEAIAASRARYENLDRIFLLLKDNPRKNVYTHVDPLYFMKNDLIVSIRYDGELALVSACGYHRLSIAVALGIAKIPVRIGYVDWRQLDKFNYLKGSE